MPQSPGRGDGDDRRGGFVPRRTPRLVGAGVMLLVLGTTAVLGYDHRRLDLRGAWRAIPDGRVAIIDSSGYPGPRSLVILGKSSVKVRRLPPVLRHSTSVGPARGPGGLRVSPAGWVLIRLGRTGNDTGGGQITEISPAGELTATFPLLRWRDAEVVGITDRGLSVFRRQGTLIVLGPYGDGDPLLHLDTLGVRPDLSNLADVALAADGSLAVLVGTSQRQGEGYRLFVREPGGDPRWVAPVAGAALFDPAPDTRQRKVVPPSLTFAGRDVLVAGDASLLRFREGRMRSRITIRPSDRGRLRTAPSSLVAQPDERSALGRDPLSVLDRSGRLHRPGSGPCPAEAAIHRRCPAVLAGRQLPQPRDVLPSAAQVALGAVLLALAFAARERRSELRRTRDVVTVLGATWITMWLVTSLLWGDLHGSAPLLLLGVAVAAILGPAFPRNEHPALLDQAESSPSRYEPWVSERIAGPTAAGAATQRLEVTPLPSRT